MRPVLPCLLAAALALAACATPDYYLLPPAPAAARQASPVRTIVVADLNLPAYAGALEIAELTGPDTLRLAKRSLWADTPPRALTRHLAAALEARLGAEVATEPWPGFDSPGLRVEVTVDRMIGAPGTGLEFAGQYAVVAPAERPPRRAAALRVHRAAAGRGLSRPDGRPLPRNGGARRPHRGQHLRPPRGELKALGDLTQ